MMSKKTPMVGNRTLSKAKYLLYLYLLLFIVLLLLHCLTNKSADDLRYMRHANEQTLCEFVGFRYFHWSSRIIIDSTIMLFSALNIWIWRIFDSLLLTLLPYLMFIMFTNGKLYTHIIGCLSILLFPFWTLLAQLPLASSITCLWPIALCLLTFIPLKTNCHWWGSIGCLLVLCFCANSEQMCCVLLGLIAVKMFDVLYINQKLYS